MPPNKRPLQLKLDGILRHSVCKCRSHRLQLAGEHLRQGLSNAGWDVSVREFAPVVGDFKLIRGEFMAVPANSIVEMTDRCAVVAQNLCSKNFASETLEYNDCGWRALPVRPRRDIWIEADACSLRPTSG